MVGIGADDLSVAFDVGVSRQHGHGNGDGVTHADTTVTASGKLNLKSDQDTTPQGAQRSGESVKADVGRDLTLSNEQDASTYASRQSGRAIGLSAISANRTRIDSDYASVNQQSGLMASAGGFDVTVGRHTQLDGAVISHTTDPVGHVSVSRQRHNSDTIRDIHLRISCNLTGVNSKWCSQVFHERDLSTSM